MRKSLLILALLAVLLLSVRFVATHWNAPWMAPLRAATFRSGTRRAFQLRSWGRASTVSSVHRD